MQFKQETSQDVGKMQLTKKKKKNNASMYHTLVLGIQPSSVILVQMK